MLSVVKMAIIKNSQKINAGEGVERGELSHIVDGNEMSWKERNRLKDFPS